MLFVHRLTDMSQEMAVNAYDIVSTFQAMGMMKYWKGKHIILKKQVSQAGEKVCATSFFVVSFVLKGQHIVSELKATSSCVLVHKTDHLHGRGRLLECSVKESVAFSLLIMWCLLNIHLAL